MSMPIVVDLFKPITNKVIDKLNISINYMHGHPVEIMESLTELTETAKLSSTSVKKYPLIALFEDIDQKKRGQFYELNLHLIIAMLTDNTLKAPDRYIHSFKPYLIPIFDELINQIAKSGSFHECTIDQIECDPINRLYWGRNGLFGNDGNVFNDYIDCIEIQNLKLKAKIKNNNC